MATLVTTRGKAMIADRLKNGAAGTYTTEPKWTAMGTGSHTAAVGDLTLTTETADARGVGVSSLPSANVYQVVGTGTAGGARVIIEAGLFDQLASGGNMFTSADFAAVNLASGDSLQQTWQVTFT